MKNTTLCSALLMAALLFTAIFFSSCSPSLTVRLQNGPTANAPVSAKAAFSAALSPTAETILRRLSANNSASEGANTATSTQPLFDAPSIRQSLTQTGMTVESVSIPSPGAVSLSLSIPSLNGILANAFTIENGGKSLLITLSKESVSRTLALLPPETADYLELLMAPVYTGEEMTTAEYQDLIGAAYGKTLASELAKSVLTLTVYAPQPVKTVSSDIPGTAVLRSGAAIFTVPLASVLVLENPITLHAAW